MTGPAASALIPTWSGGALVPLDKTEVHRLGLKHKAVSVFVISGQETLIQRRALGKYHTPGLWANTCCTHPLWGEAADDCAIRRLHQELGITGLSPVFSGQIEYRADVGGGMTEHELVDVFVARTTLPLPLSPDPAEVQATRWITLDDLCTEVAATPEHFTPWLKIYLDDHSETIFGAGLSA